MYALSVALPLISHITRQSMACGALFQQYAFTSFLCTYSITMLLLSPYVQRNARLILRISAPLFAATFALSVWTRHPVAWTLHAIPSACFWPIAFAYVHQKRLNRFYLAAWSLSGNVGDLLGCLYPAFHSPSFLSAPFVVPTLCLLIGLAYCAFSAKDVSPPPLPLLPRPPPPPFSSSVLFLVLATTSLKSASYFASDFLPYVSKGSSGYLVYNASSVVGTLLAGACFELGAPYLSACLSSFASLLVLTFLSSPSWPLLCLFGVGCFGSLSSTMVSICLCSDISEKADGSYGKVTSLVDGAGSLVAACIQLVPKESFFVLQWVCSLLACVSILSLRAVSRPRPSRPDPPSSGSCDSAS